MSIKIKTIMLVLLGALICSSCSGGDKASDEKKSSLKSNSSSSGHFEVRVSNGTGFNSGSKRAKVHIATDEMWGLKATSWNLRVAGRKLPDEGVGETNSLGFNNTFLHMYVEIDGKKVQVGCKPEKNAAGLLKRTKYDGKTVSGEFKFKLVHCNDYFTGNPVDYPKGDLWVEGEFNNLTIK